MSIVWTSIMVACICIMLITNPEAIFNTILSGGEKSIALSLKLWGIYTVWLGILKIIEDTKLDEKIARLLSPVINKLFGKLDPDTKRQVAINLTSNVLGMGNACTPSGIAGMAGMDKGTGKITRQMSMFFILNTASLQIIPSTIIGLRALAGSSSPNDIIFPILISSFAAVVSGLILVHLFSRIHFKRKKKEARAPRQKSVFKTGAK